MTRYLLEDVIVITYNSPKCVPKNAGPFAMVAPTGDGYNHSSSTKQSCALNLVAHSSRTTALDERINS
ncbi:hypothetical protein NPIL_37631 [Nephila pilipes]|uniref:Uncharacterized protein n=1 Tax=Nephila pilipes TaxID=299642 RepID=A0A8X6NNL3_NEPPI|nr:hypothetical protein NPIL_37631 [Nephila pilipes]